MKILLVEDHFDSLLVLSKILTKRGHEVLTAGTLSEARRLCQTDGLELLICDIVLPDGDGWELADLARGRGATAIALTGLGMQADEKRSAESGFAAHVIKPISFAVLEDAMKTVAPARKPL